MDALDAARDLLPSALPWLNAVLFPAAAAAVTAIALRLAMHLARPRLPRSAHWTERASERCSGTTLQSRTYLLSLLVAILFSPSFVGPVGRVDLVAMFAILAAGVVGTAIAVPDRHALRLFPWLDRRTLRRASVLQVLVFLPVWIPTLLTMALLPASPGPVFYVVLGVGLATLALAIAGAGLDVARRFGLIRPAPPELEAIVRRAAAATDGRPPRVFVADFESASAFAFPLRNTLCFSTRTVEILDDAEFDRVAAHELSHLNEPWVDTAKRLLGVPYLLLLMLGRPALDAWPITVVVLAVLAGTALGALTMKVVLRLERAADVDARTDDPAAAAVYAGALETIYRESLLPAVSAKEPGTHPELYDRMTEAGVTPDYPRPEPPRSRTGQLAIVAATLVALYAAVWGSSRMLLRAAPDHETAALAAAVLTGGDEMLLVDLGIHRLDHGEMEAAVTFHEAAVALEPEDPVFRIYLHEALLAAGRPEAAQVEFEEARRLAGGGVDLEPWVLPYLEENTPVLDSAIGE